MFYLDNFRLISCRQTQFYTFKKPRESVKGSELYAGVSEAILQGSPGECGRGDRRGGHDHTVRQSYRERVVSFKHLRYDSESQSECLSHVCQSLRFVYFFRRVCFWKRKILEKNKTDLPKATKYVKYIYFKSWNMWKKDGYRGMDWTLHIWKWLQ